MDAKDAKKDANSKHQINTSEFSISEKYFSMHQLMVTFSDSFIYNAYNIKKKITTKLK